MKNAIVTGITGMDGSYLCDQLIKQGYKVYGLYHRTSSPDMGNISHRLNDPMLEIVEGDLLDLSSMTRLCTQARADMFFNMAAMSHVGTSFNQPLLTANVTGIGVLNCLEAIRLSGIHTRFIQASTSEMYGGLTGCAANEETNFHPRSPYGVAKLYGYWITVNYRETYKMFACNSICFNHEGPRRHHTFVTRKITKAVANIKLGKQDKLYLGNLEAKRDWGYAPDFCLNLDVPLLTPNGWKYYNDLQVGEKVINFNTNFNRLEEDTVKAKCLLPSSGEKVLLSGIGCKLNVSSNHRICFQKKSINSKGGWSKWQFCTAKEFAEKINNISLRNKYNFRLPGSQSYNKKDLPISDEQIYLLGMLLAEGCFSDTGNLGRGIRVSISQSKTRNKKIFKKIEAVIEKLQLDWTLKERNDGVCEWCFNADSSRKILDWFDTYDVHQMPKYCFGMSQRQCKILFESFMDGDGCWGASSLSQSRLKLAVDIQTIIHLSGRRTSELRKRIDCNGNISYGMQIISAQNPYLHITEATLWNDKAEQVWCIETNNGTLISRDMGCISISGNCEGMIKILQSDTPTDYVLATGETHTVREFCDAAFSHVGLDYKDYVEIDPRFFRPCEVDVLIGDYSKINKKLGWAPTITFSGLVEQMVDHDLSLLE